MNKNKILFLTCIAISIGLSSCSDDSFVSNGENNGENTETVELAKKWYRNTAETRSSSSNQLIYDEPSWLYFAEQSSKSQIVLDVDVTDRVQQDFVLENSVERYKETENYDFRRSYTRLIYKRDTETGKEIGFFMTIVPSVYYTKTYRQRIEKRNTYLSRDKYLGGYVLYHNLKGEFVNGWKYKSGKVIAKVSQASKMDSSKTTVAIAKVPAKYIVKASLYTPNKTRSWEDDGSWWFDDVFVYPEDPTPVDDWDWDWIDPGSDYTEDPGPGDGWYDSEESPGVTDIEQLYPEYNKLTKAEKQFVKDNLLVALDFRTNANKASLKANDLYPNSIHNGQGDAFRHALWSAFNTVSHGAGLAREYGNAHETDPNQPLGEKQMDLHNNDVGYEIGNQAIQNGWSDDRIEQEVQTALDNGRLQTSL